MEPRKKDVLDYVLPIMGAVFLIYIFLFAAPSFQLMKEQAVETGFDDYKILVADFLERIEEDPHDIRYCEYTMQCLGTGVFILLLIAGAIYSEQKKFINGKEYGTSEWGKNGQLNHLLSKNILKEQLRELKREKGYSKTEKLEKEEELRCKYTEASEMIFTKTERMSMYKFELNNNVFILGGAGAGKTRGYVLVNILQLADNPYSPSIVVTDPKGEILPKVGYYLDVVCHYDIKVVNLKEQERSFCYNPFKYVLPKQFESDIADLVFAIFHAKTDDKAAEKDPFWSDMAELLISSIALAVYEVFPEKDKTMNTVMALFRWFEVSDNDDRYKNPTKLDKFFDEIGDVNGVNHVTDAILDFYREYVKFVVITQVGYNMPTDKKIVRKKIAIPIHSADTRVADSYKHEIKTLVSLVENTIRALRESPEMLIDIKMKPQEFESIAMCFDAFHEMADKTIREIDWYVKERQTNYENMKMPIGVQLYNQYGDENNNPALQKWEDFRTKVKGKTAQSVTATALHKLAPFDEKEIRRIMSKDELELELLGEKHMAVFIVLPPVRRRYNFISNIVYKQMFAQLEYSATVIHADKQQLPVPVEFIMDEAYNTGAIPDFENIISYARSFGISISMVFQSLGQIKEMYEKTYSVIMDNCASFLYLGQIKDEETRKYVSGLLGEGTYDKKTYGYSKGRQSSTNTNYDKIGRKLLDESEVGRLKKKKCLFMVTGYHPHYSDKADYKKHKNYKFTYDAHKKYYYYYKTPLEVEEMKKKELIKQNPHGEEAKKIVSIAESTMKQKVVKKPIEYFEDDVKIMNFYNSQEARGLVPLNENGVAEIAMSIEEQKEYEILLMLKEEQRKAEEYMQNALQGAVKYSLEASVLARDIVNISKMKFENVSSDDVDTIYSSDVAANNTENVKHGEDEEYEDDTIDEIELLRCFENEMQDFNIDSFEDLLRNTNGEELTNGELEDMEIETA